MRDLDGSGGRDVSRFQIQDPFLADSDFFAIRSQFPWGENQPNDFYGIQNCVELRRPEEEWHDIPCFRRQRHYVCRRTCDAPAQKSYELTTLVLIVLSFSGGILALYKIIQCERRGIRNLESKIEEINEYQATVCASGRQLLPVAAEY